MNIRYKQFLYVIIAVLFVCTPAFAASFSGQVVGIIDGDTIEVLHNGKPERIRLHGIDCPERNQAYGTKAKQFASDLAFKQKVTVRVTDIDRYGRTVGVIILPDGKSLNRELVRAGFAWWYRKYAPDDKELEALEETARASQRGLWADPDPVFLGVSGEVQGVNQPTNLRSDYE